MRSSTQRKKNTNVGINVIAKLHEKLILKMKNKLFRMTFGVLRHAFAVFSWSNMIFLHKCSCEIGKIVKAAVSCNFNDLLVSFK